MKTKENDLYTVFNGSNLDVLPELIKSGVKVDAIITDPPYEIAFMGKKWDNTGIAYNTDLWKLCLEILKPGGYLLAFGATRTYHRLAVAIEDAGFEIRDTLAWIYGSGFPKSKDISKELDKRAGETRPVIGTTKSGGFKRIMSNNVEQGFRPNDYYEETGNSFTSSDPICDLAKKWKGWGSALKPAMEPIVFARKPLEEKTLTDNVIKHGTGAINIDACRIPLQDGETISVGFNTPGNINEGWDRPWMHDEQKWSDYKDKSVNNANTLGRWPANIIHDGSEEVMNEFDKYGNKKSGSNCIRTQEGFFGACDDKHSGLGKAGDIQTTYGDEGSVGRYFKNINEEQRGSGGFWKESSGKPCGPTYNDIGSNSRFFYSAKASSEDRAGSKHPTVKPIALMQYLCKLVTPKNGVVLDIFAGSGTTGEAAIKEGFKPILIEKEEQYYNDIVSRLEKYESNAFYNNFDIE